MKKCLIVMTTLMLVAVLSVGCAGMPSLPMPAPSTPASSTPVPSTPTPATSTPAPSPESTSAVEKSNFRVWISDEVNNIDHFKSLLVTITGIGVVKSGEGDNVTHIDVNFTEVTVDLKDLQEDNATLLWDGQLEDGDYVKVFLYATPTEWTLVDENATAEVKLPSSKLHISKPFTLTNNQLPVDFVCDVTVVKAGRKDIIGGKYILKPQIAASGTGQNIVPVEAQGKTEKHKEQHEEHNEEQQGKPEKGELSLEIVEGDIAPGENITLQVTFEDEPVAEAMVEVNGEKLDDLTDEDGEIIFTIPENADKLEIEVKKGKLEGELEIEFQE